MPYVFIIPLAVAAGCIYIFKNAVDEIAYLAISISVFSMLLGLVLAPWPLQLLLVIALLLSYKRAAY